MVLLSKICGSNNSQIIRTGKALLSRRNYKKGSGNQDENSGIFAIEFGGFRDDRKLSGTYSEFYLQTLDSCFRGNNS
jgi:hypothetical protein